MCERYTGDIIFGISATINKIIKKTADIILLFANNQVVMG